MHIDLMIITTKKINIPADLNINYIVLENIVLDDIYKANNISFDYLIFDDINTIKKTDILMQDNIVITNQYLQTSYEHIYAIGSINNCNLSIEKQFEIIIENIKHNI